MLQGKPIIRQIDSLVGNESLIRQIADIDCFLPLEWDDSYTFNSAELELEYIKLKNALKEELKMCHFILYDNFLSGFIIFSVVSRKTSKINSIWIRPQHRKLGYASLLMSDVEDWCKSNGIEYLEARVNPKNQKMKKLAVKLGYSQNGIIMTKSLS
jgi:GNAT superfamily N-acetyltransferase